MFVKSPLRYATAVIVLVVTLLAVSSAPAITTAQGSTSDQCTQVLSLVQKNLSTGCASLNRGEACYGNAPITVEYQNPSTAGQSPFAKAGDIVGINLLKSVVTGPLKVSTNEWGVAVLRVQADDLPGTTAGQAVTFVLFGDVSLTEVKGPSQGSLPAAVTASCTGTATRGTYLRNAPNPSEQQIQLVAANSPVNVMRRLADGSWVFVESKGKTGWLLANYVKLDCQLNDLVVDDPSKPIALPNVRSFYFTTGVASSAACRDVPTGGMLIQSPSGHRVALNINGVDMTIGSTVLFTASSNNVLDAFVLDGHLIVTLNGQQYVLNPGQGALINETDQTLLRQLKNAMFSSLGSGQATALLTTIVQLMKALGLDVSPDIQEILNPPPTGNGQPTASATPVVCTQRTLMSNGMVCIPNYGVYPCNQDGICNNGEITYTCPEDCGNPLPPGGLGGGSDSGGPVSTVEPTYPPFPTCNMNGICEQPPEDNNCSDCL